MRRSLCKPPEVIEVNCERCQEASGFDVGDGGMLCQACLLMIVAEWRIKRDEFGELAGTME